MRRTRRTHSIPWKRWIAYTLIAFGGSAVYGASLSALFPRWDLQSGVLWIIFSSGLGWLVLGTGMIIGFRRKLSILTMTDICMVTMAYGILVLMLASFVNMLALFVLPSSHFMTVLNFLMIAASNITMAAVFANRLRRHGVSVLYAVLMWIVLLDGSGAIFFWKLERMLP